jgi:hypothetical protein
MPASTPTVDWCDVAQVTIDMLPDVALLEIFDFYAGDEDALIMAWSKLVHVCRKWRNVVFGSPRRLNLRLWCGTKTPVRKMLDVWPPFPIYMSAVLMHGMQDEAYSMDDIIAALEQNDRICDLFLNFPGSQKDTWEKVFAVMQQPFPALEHLDITPRYGVNDKTLPVVPTSFLGGSTPQLQYLSLMSLPFPGLPNLLLSATRLGCLYLHKIPLSGYISPEVMVTCLSVLNRLKSLVIEFESSRCRPDQKSRRPPPPARTPLPALTEFHFKGVNDYLEDLVARIDAPLLDNVMITYFHQPIFDTPQLTQFISRTPKLKEYHTAALYISNLDAHVELLQKPDGILLLKILCERPAWQLSFLSQVCSSSFPQGLIRAVEALQIIEYWPLPEWQDDIANSQWLELFHPFTAVKGLYICRKVAPRIAHTLQELVGERVLEELPALQTLFFEETLPSGLVKETIGHFVAAREVASHPITISWYSRWTRWGGEESEEDE